MKATVLFVGLLVLSTVALSDAQGGGGGGAAAAAPANAAPATGDAPAAKKAPAPKCECPLPAGGGGYFGRGQDLVKAGCDCQNACEFRPSPAGPKPSCATVCKCSNNVNVQTFNQNRGPLILQPGRQSVPWLLGRKLKTGDKVYVEL
ncbi:hypothetical protein MNEG_10268 [Monoraphidium neglectum]|uniref:Uncharacterized protein n=1 Tax=Monoraphidium neglectum TaxID=145388 RepID=A0A0D2KQ40_9CHLO|nr:hypothetical protein MNEG_10268 [Monoraphidium neglectum]KIY97693.1 hypothetical protein MNEG_10268 [Monoraphidium neglectum]|eukprot:XP_013896713.1 hypothetical protein MNEG_10268 [Monoraphidium neglectum]